jgi:hypothetical protein
LVLGSGVGVGVERDVVGVPVEIALRWAACRGDRGRRGGQTEVDEDLLDDVGVIDKLDRAHGTGAAGANENLIAEDAGQELSPRASVGGAGRVVLGLSLFAAGIVEVRCRCRR